MKDIKIIKRDGTIVDYNLDKIKNAIKKAFYATNSIDNLHKTIDRDSFNCASLVNKQIDIIAKDLNYKIDVESVQDIVEKVLMHYGYPETAKAYILYRNERNRVRELNSRLMKSYKEIVFSDAKDSNLLRENANIDGDTAMGSMLKFGSEGAKHFYDMYIIDPRFSTAHADGDIHIHDKDFYTLTTTCCQIELKSLFKGGFSTGHGVVRDPNSIGTYAALACIAIQANQNDQHGGQSIVDFDYTMADGVKKTFERNYYKNLSKLIGFYCRNLSIDNIDKKIKEIKDAIKINFDMSPTIENCGDYMKEEKKLLKDTFKNFVGPSDNVIEDIQEFAYKEAVKETNRDTYQAMEALVHNLNTMHSRAGAQTPFSSINYGMNTSPEARMAIKNLLLATEAGLGNGETPIFPIQIFRVKEGVNYNPEDPNYDLFKLAIRCSAKRLFPNFSFIDAPFNLKYYDPNRPETEIAYMGCRTRVMSNIHDKSREICNRRGNLSFTSINLPRLGIEAHGDLNKFYKDLDEKIDLCIDQLLERFEIQCRKHVYNYPFLMGQGVWIDSEKLKPTDEVREVLKHGTLSVGFIGLAETLKALIGVHHGESEEAQKLGLEIISHMRKRMDDAAEKHQLNFSLLATPAEGLSGRFVNIDKKKYGIIEGITDKDYYTNSFHVPVYYDISAFKKIQLEAPYHELTNAGHISYIEMDGDPTKNLEAFEKVIRCMKESGIGYGSINHPVDRDPECGYTGIINDVCPKCGKHEGPDHPIDRIRRITGYLVGTLDRFNDAKKAEEQDRVKHDI